MCCDEVVDHVVDLVDREGRRCVRVEHRRAVHLLAVAVDQNMRPSRGVFVDFGQNSRDKTIAAAYSVRPTPEARVSAPLAWEEVPTVEPQTFTVETMRDRIADVGDLTEGMWRRKVSLRPRFAKLGLDRP